MSDSKVATATAAVSNQPTKKRKTKEERTADEAKDRAELEAEDNARHERKAKDDALNASLRKESVFCRLELMASEFADDINEEWLYEKQLRLIKALTAEKLPVFCQGCPGHRSNKFVDSDIGSESLFLRICEFGHVTWPGGEKTIGNKSDLPRLNDEIGRLTWHEVFALYWGKYADEAYRVLAERLGLAVIVFIREKIAKQQAKELQLTRLYNEAKADEPFGFRQWLQKATTPSAAAVAASSSSAAAAAAVSV